MIDKKRFQKILEEVDFEFSVKQLEKFLNEAQANSLMSWIERWKMNLRQFARLRIDFKTWLLEAWELPETDSRYDPEDNRLYPKENAPEEAVRLAKMENEFSSFGEYLPILEFSREELYG